MRHTDNNDDTEFYFDDIDYDEEEDEFCLDWDKPDDFIELRLGAICATLRLPETKEGIIYMRMGLGLDEHYLPAYHLYRQYRGSHESFCESVAESLNEILGGYIVVEPKSSPVEVIASARELPIIIFNETPFERFRHTYNTVVFNLIIGYILCPIQYTNYINAARDYDEFLSSINDKQTIDGEPTKQIVKRTKKVKKPNKIQQRVNKSRREYEETLAERVAQLNSKYGSRGVYIEEEYIYRAKRIAQVLLQRKKPTVHFDFVGAESICQLFSR